MTSPQPGPHVEVVTSLSPGDAAAVAELLTAAEAADGFSSISEQARLGVDGGGGALALVARGGGAGSLLVGYGVLTRSPGGWTLETAVHPLHRSPTRGTQPALVEAAIDHVARAGGGRLAVWQRDGASGGATGEGEGEGTWFAAAGFAPERQLLQLRAPLPVTTGRPTPDHPLDVRPFHPGRDEAAWLEVNRRAFAGHPEQGSWTLADLERREHAPWFDPRGFLIHEVGGRIAGFCWTKVHRVPLVGEIYVIGVDPDFQWHGLGRALTVAGLDHLATRGVPDAMLYVEATNTAALALYRSLGFAEDHRETLQVATIAAYPGNGGR